MKRTPWRCGKGRPRWFHRLWANWRGYFWLPCPVCGRCFGGQEWEVANRIYPWPAEPLQGQIACSSECRAAFEVTQALEGSGVPPFEVIDGA